MKLDENYSAFKADPSCCDAIGIENVPGTNRMIVDDSLDWKTACCPGRFNEWNSIHGTQGLDHLHPCCKNGAGEAMYDGIMSGACCDGKTPSSYCRNAPMVMEVNALVKCKQMIPL